METIVFKGVRQQWTLVVSPKADSKRPRQRDRRAGADLREQARARPQAEQCRRSRRHCSLGRLRRGRSAAVSLRLTAAQWDSAMLLFDGPPGRRDDLLAHGAGASMGSRSMTASANALAGEGFRVARFEFDYVAARRPAVGRMPPARAEKLNPRYIAAVDALGRQGELVIVATRWAGASRAWSRTRC